MINGEEEAEEEKKSSRNSNVHFLNSRLIMRMLVGVGTRNVVNGPINSEAVIAAMIMMMTFRHLPFQSRRKRESSGVSGKYSHRAMAMRFA